MTENPPDDADELLCYNKDSRKDEEPYLEKCATGGCMLTYSFNSSYYNQNGTPGSHLEGHSEGERKDLTVLSAQCIIAKYYTECINSTDSCEHFWSIPQADDIYHLHCCCTGSRCNHIVIEEILFFSWTVFFRVKRPYQDAVLMTAKLKLAEEIAVFARLSLHQRL